MRLIEQDLREKFLKYVTGRLTGAERERFEDRLLSDQEFSDDASACEQELIDDYAARKVNKDDLEGLHVWIQASPRRLERVEISQALLRAQRPRPQFSGRGPALLAIAACILIAATLAFVFRAGELSRRQLRQDTAGSHPPSASAPPVGPPVPPAAARPEIVLLVAERIRGDQQIPVFAIHRDAVVEFQVVVPPSASDSRYGLSIAPAGAEARPLYAEKTLPTATTGGQTYIAATLPAGLLAPGDYAAIVTGAGVRFVLRFELRSP